jgi:hypothetical protein
MGRAFDRVHEIRHGSLISAVDARYGYLYAEGWAESRCVAEMVGLIERTWEAIGCCCSGQGALGI